MLYLILISSYLLGSLLPGYFLFWLTDKKDIRSFGSGNPGATNVFRLKGWKWGLPVFVFDLGKGLGVVLISKSLFQETWVPLATGALVILGHCFPFYLKFKGGKGIATSLGVFAGLSFLSFCTSLLVFSLVVGLTRYVSLGSLTSVFSFGPFSWLYHHRLDIILFWIVILFLVIIRHRENLMRLFQGTERKLGAKK